MSRLVLVAIIGLVSASPFFSRPGVRPEDSFVSTGLTLMVDGALVALNGSLGAHVEIAAPAPVGGVMVTLGSQNSAIAVPAIGSILIPEGFTSSPSFAILGVGLGSTTLTADASGCPQATATITTTNQYISLGTNFAVVPGQTAGLPISLSIPAPVGGVTLGLSVAPAGVVGLQSMVFIPQGSQTPIANPQVTGIAIGTAEVTATALGFAPDTRAVTVASNVLSFTPSPLNVPEGLTANVLVNLQVAAPPGGLMVSLTTDHPSVATTPSSVFITQGSNSIATVISGLVAGSTTLRATAANSAPAAVSVNVITPVINLPSLSIGDDLQVPVSGTLTAPAPSGNLVITLTSPNVNSLLLANTVAAAGSQSIQVTVTAGATTIPTFYAHALDDSGVISIQASASGYTANAGTITFSPSGIVLFSPASISTAAGATPTAVSVRAARLTGSLNYAATQAIRGGFSALVTVGTADPLVGFISNSPVSITGGQSTATADFVPQGPGNTSIMVVAPSGFETPTGLQTIPVIVSQQAIALGAATIGQGLQTSMTGTLSAQAPAGNLAVTLSSDDPSSILLSTTPTGAGSTSIVVTVPAGLTQLPTWYAQALSSTGTPTVTATAMNYGFGTANFTLVPSGFVIWSPASLNVSVGAAPANVTIRAARLDPLTALYAGTQQVRGGTSVSVDVLSNNTGVGIVPVSPLTFSGGVSSLTTAFVGLATGSTTVGLLTPAGFTTPGELTSIPASVFDQLITVAGGDIGKDLQISTTASLSAPAPAGNLQVTLTSMDPALLLALDEFTLGTQSITVQINAGLTTTAAFWVHALQDMGSASISAQAPGYANGMGTFNLHPSGFRIQSPGNFTTSTFSAPTVVSVRAARLNATTAAPVTTQRLRGGVSALVPVTSSDTNVGTLLPNLVMMTGGTLTSTADFTPLTAGATTLAIGTVQGFSQPSSNTSIVATVTAPSLNLGASFELGNNLQVSRSLTLGSAPPNPVNITVSMLDPSVANVSTNGTMAGGPSVTFSNVSGTTAGTVFIQGLSLGSTTVRAQAPGYSDAVLTVMVRPSGFIWQGAGSLLDTTFASPPTNLSIRAAVLNVVTLVPGATQQLRGGFGINLILGSTLPQVGTLSPNPISIPGGVLTHTASFLPNSAGQTTLNILTPVGFWTPSTLTSVAAIVRSPNIQMASSIVGRNLQVSRAITLEAPVSGPTVFTVAVDNTSVATISKSSAAVGGGTATFSISSGTSVGTVYIHGLSLGATQVLVSARGFEAVKADVTVDPAGFAFQSPSSISTTSFSAPTNVVVRGYLLNPVTLNPVAAQSVRGGPDIIISSQSSNSAVGALNPDFVRIPAGTLSGSTSFVPNSGGSTTLSLVAPSGFSTPSAQASIVATVSAPGITATAAIVGRDLQVSQSLSLQAAPPSPVNVTCTVGDASVALLSLGFTTVGSTSVTFPGVSGTSIGTLWVQGVASGSMTAITTTTMTVSAPGYTPTTVTLQVHPSGFVISSPSSISTTTASAATSVTVRPARLNPVTLNSSANQILRAGVMVSVSVSSLTPAVGTISTGILSFSGGMGPLSTTFVPLAAGMTNVSIATPSGWSTPSNLQSISATVIP